MNTLKLSFSSVCIFRYYLDHLNLDPSYNYCIVSIGLKICRFLDAYREQNLTFWALTTGNEPINGIVPVNRFNSMGWTPMSHREWIGRFMGPQLRASDHSGTLLFAIDDQRIVLPWWMKMVRQNSRYYNKLCSVAFNFGNTNQKKIPKCFNYCF